MLPKAETNLTRLCKKYCSTCKLRILVYIGQKGFRKASNWTVIIMGFNLISDLCQQYCLIYRFKDNLQWSLNLYRVSVLKSGKQLISNDHMMIVTFH